MDSVEFLTTTVAAEQSFDDQVHRFPSSRVIKSYGHMHTGRISADCSNSVGGDHALESQ